MNNRVPFPALLRRRRRRIAIQTFEEDYALGLPCETALAFSRPGRIWSVARGVREGLVESSRPLPEIVDPTSAPAPPRPAGPELALPFFGGRCVTLCGVTGAEGVSQCQVREEGHSQCQL